MKLTAIEKETIFLWNEAENEIAIMSYDKEIIAKLKIIAKQNPQICKLKKMDCGGIATSIKKENIEINFK